jgi:hypothetical protein
MERRFFSYVFLSGDPLICRPNPFQIWSQIHGHVEFGSNSEAETTIPKSIKPGQIRSDNRSDNQEKTWAGKVF